MWDGFGVMEDYFENEADAMKYGFHVTGFWAHK